ncbi:MAG TPA: retropepsin-like aspartic protease, partial [Pyrinomonadaceae bacterium]|nr:retropepsin-like aspartic protease [Pyrinomonadaceae bacterium]
MPRRKSPRKTATPVTFAILTLFLLGVIENGSAQSRSAPVEVPFEFVHNQIVVTVKIGGKGPYHMLVDTGSDPSAIDLATAKELGLGLDSRSYAATGAGSDTQTGQMTRLPSIEIGTIVARDLVAGAIDLKKLSERLERPIQGVLGYTFLR